MTIHEIVDTCAKYNIDIFSINDDGSIDVEGDVDLFNYNLINLPLKFNNISGNFVCSSNNLSSLKGSPIRVGGTFSCWGNKLKNLYYSPKIIGEDFCISDNELTDFSGFNGIVGGYIYFHENKITVDAIVNIMSENDIFNHILYDYFETTPETIIARRKYLLNEIIF